MPYCCRVGGLDKHFRGPFDRKEAVADWPYIELNQKTRIKHLILDLDSDHAILDWHDSNIPFLPSYFVGRQKNGIVVRPHAVIKLRIPVDKNSWGQMRLMRVIHHKILELLADEGCNVDYKMPTLTKNPRFKKVWKTVVGDPREWTLYELRDALGIPEKDDLDEDDLRVEYSIAGTYFNADEAASGRNCFVFQSVRGLAYVYKSKAMSEADMFNYVLEQCIEIDSSNHPHRPMSFKELKGIAESVSWFTWHKYKGSGANNRVVDHGACKRLGLINDGMSLTQKQAVGGRYGATEHCKKTLQRVVDMLRQLEAEGRDLGLKAMSREFGISRNTIKKYRDFAAAELRQNAPTEVSSDQPARGVKPVHQESGLVEEPWGEALEVEVAGEVVKLWLVPGNPDMVANERGVEMPRAFFADFLPDRVEDPPDDHIEVPHFL